MGQITKAAEQAATPAQVTPKAYLAEALEKNKAAIGMSLPRGMSADRFKRLLLTNATTTPKLLACDVRSFIAAAVGAAQLGLEPGDARGLAYLVPFKENKKDGSGKWTSTDKVQLIIGYRGYVDLARRSGMVSSINAFPVFEGDHFDYRLGLEPTIDHVPCDGDEDPMTLTHVYAVAKVQGEPQFVVLTRNQIEKARQRSQTGKDGNGPWGSDYVEMAKKTAVRRLCKLLPMTVEAANAEALDERPLMLGDIGVAPADHDAIEASGIDTETGEIIDAEVVES